MADISGGGAGMAGGGDGGGSRVRIQGMRAGGKEDCANSPKKKLNVQGKKFKVERWGTEKHAMPKKDVRNVKILIQWE